VLEIAKSPDDAYRYTAKGNLVAVISNGTAILGLGNLGALASKPVMERKGVLFADIDVFDIEIDSLDTDEIVRSCQMIAPSFGGINLEDIRAPECFEIERRLVETLDIPVFHDDQHGTAIISGAALLNAALLTDRKLENARIVFSGAGASGIACAKLYKDLGVRAENSMLHDTRGVIYKGRGWEIQAPFRTSENARCDNFRPAAATQLQRGGKEAQMAGGRGSLCEVRTRRRRLLIGRVPLPQRAQDRPRAPEVAMTCFLGSSKGRLFFLSPQRAAVGIRKLCLRLGAAKPGLTRVSEGPEARRVTLPGERAALGSRTPSELSRATPFPSARARRGCSSRRRRS
jgi:hypothetical protein